MRTASASSHHPVQRAAAAPTIRLLIHSWQGDSDGRIFIRGEGAIFNVTSKDERSRYYCGRITALRAWTLAHDILCGLNRDHMIEKAIGPGRFAQRRERARCHRRQNERDRVWGSATIVTFCISTDGARRYHMNEQFVVVVVCLACSDSTVDVTLWRVMASTAENITCGGFVFFNNFDSANLAKVEPVKIPETFEKGNAVVSLRRDVLRI